MAEPYHVLTEIDIEPANLNPATAVGDGGQAADDTFGAGYVELAAALVLWNPPGSGKVMRLKHFGIQSQRSARTPTATTGSAGTLWLQRTTAQNAQSGKPLFPSKLDQASAAWPSLVHIRRNPEVTLSEQPFRASCRMPLSNLFGGNWFGRFIPEAETYGAGLGMLFGNRDTSLQSIVLREGEGVAIKLNPFGDNLHGTLGVSFALTIAGATYWFFEHVRMVLDVMAIGVFNQSGSGVVVTLSRVSIVDGEHGAQNNSALGRIGGSFWLMECSWAKAGQDVPVVKMDSSQPSMPTAVKVWRTASVLMLPANRSQVLDAYLGSYGDGFLRGPQTPHGYLETESSGASLCNFGKIGWTHVFESKSGYPNNAEYVIRPGRGVALLKHMFSLAGNAKGLSNPHDVDIAFSVEDGPAEAAAGISRSRIFARS